MTSLPYSEPPLLTILSVSGFVIALNLAAYIIDRLCCAGLLAQVALGALWGSPLGNALSHNVEETIQILGYLALLLLVAQGGAEMRLDILANKKILGLAVLVGLTGCAMPIALSLLVLPFAFGFTMLQSFAGGAALSATSLGTVLSLLSAVKERDGNSQHNGSDTPARHVQSTRIGTILIGAALLDDIIGLVLSKIVQVLGSTFTHLQGWHIALPILSSIIMIVIVALLSRYLLQPLAARLARASPSLRSRVPRWLALRLRACSPGGVAIAAYVTTLFVFITIAHYVGTSPLLGVFCAGALMNHTYLAFRNSATPQHLAEAWSPQIVNQTLEPLTRRLLLPFFFASVGFAIPLRSLFTATVVWQGFVYGGLMLVAKALAGGWPPLFEAIEHVTRGRHSAEDGEARPVSCISRVIWRRNQFELESQSTVPRSVSAPLEVATAEPPQAFKPPWLAPAFLLGLSLIARGEIGFLILGLAQQSGLVGGVQDSTDAAQRSYLVCIWALLINTLAGPLLVGIMVKWKDGIFLMDITHGRWGIVGTNKGTA